MLTNLLFGRRFLPLCAVQTIGIFADNVFKNALIIMITYGIGLSGDYDAKKLVTVAAGVYILPFLLFSGVAGQFADKYERVFLTKILKCADVGLMILATVALVYAHTGGLLVLLGLAGSLTAAFGPIKYAILPHHVPPTHLLAANSWFEAGRFLAILTGTLAGGMLITLPHGVVWVGMVLILTTILTAYVAFLIPHTPAPAPNLRIDRNIFKTLVLALKPLQMNGHLLLLAMAIGWFWFVGSIYMAQLPLFVKDVWQQDAQVAAITMAAFTIGIAIGSGVCGFLLRYFAQKKVTAGALLGMGLAGLWLNFGNGYAQDPIMAVANLGLLAACGGVFIVPLYTALQRHSPDTHRARIIAASSTVNAGLMVIATMTSLAFFAAGLGVAQLFVGVAVLNIVLGLFLFSDKMKS